MKDYHELASTSCANLPDVGISIKMTEDPSEAIQLAGDFLQTSALENNLLLSILRERQVRPRPGRYWVAQKGGLGCGVVVQSPLESAAVISSMPKMAIAPIVAAVACNSPELTGVTGPAAVAALFAGAWTEVRSSAAISESVQRLYRLTELRPPFGVSGHLRAAGSADLDILTEWAVVFMAELGRTLPHPRETVERRFVAGQVWVWDDGQPVSMAMNSSIAGAVSRIHNVYTPRELRGRGYASAATAELSRRIVGAGATAVLYTDLSNATANRIYRRLGYQAVAEILGYRFSDDQSVASIPGIATLQQN